MKKSLLLLCSLLIGITSVFTFFGCVNETIIKEIHYTPKEKKFDLKVVTLETKEVPVRTVSESKVVSNSIKNGKEEKVTLGFMEGKEQIPYIFLSSELLNNYYSEKPNEHKVYEVSKVTPLLQQLQLNQKFLTQLLYLI